MADRVRRAAFVHRHFSTSQAMPSPPVLPTLSVVLIGTEGEGLPVEQLRLLADIPIPDGTQFIVASAEAGSGVDSADVIQFGEHWIAIRQPCATAAALRRAAMRAATGDIVLFTTPTTAADKLRRLLRARSALDAADQDGGGPGSFRPIGAPPQDGSTPTPFAKR